jgi:hypothetical protein
MSGLFIDNNEFGTIIEFDDRPQTRSVAEALQLHQLAAVNLAHVLAKVRSMDKKPSISDVYLGRALTPCAPPHLGLDVLVKHFNEIAKANLVANPNLDPTSNELIFYYGLEIGHSFNKSLQPCRINLVLSVFKWGSQLVGKDQAQYQDSFKLWYGYLLAWIESVNDGGNFELRSEFLQIWHTSPYDLTWFSKKRKEQLKDALYHLGKGKPPVDGDPLEFIDKCQKGDISHEDFARVGPAMAMHYLLAHEETAKEKKKRQEDETRKAHEDRRAVYAAAIAQLDEDEPIYQFSDDDDEEEEKEEEEKGVEQEEVETNGGEGEGDEMDVDEPAPVPVPEEIDLTRVPWDAPEFQALLNIDKDILMRFEEGYRPKSDRIPWMNPDDAYGTIISKGDELADLMSKVLGLQS